MTKGTSSRPEVFLALAQAYELNNSIITDRVEAILTPDATILPDILQNALDLIGDSPLLEPEKYEMLQQGNLQGFTKLCSKNVDLDKVDALASSTFLSRVRHKILSNTDKDGVFKTTPVLDLMRLPNLSEIGKFTEMAEKGESEESLEIAIFETIGLNINDLSIWEKDLAKSIVTSYAQVTSNALLGGVTDRTPFARYLKNI